jgi:G3E family GTPase
VAALLGEVGVDQAVLRDDGLTVYEITAGCICCQLGVDLVKTLELLVEQERPETVIVEASGVATPDGVLDALSYYHGPAFASTRSVGVLDPTRLEALLDVMTPLVESQIADVDELVITKVDVAAEQELELARRVVERLNSDAPLRLVSALDAAALQELARALLAPGVSR